MALRFNAQADMLTRQAVGFTPAEFSITGFGRLTANRGTFTAFVFGEKSDASEYVGIETQSDGFTLIFVTDALALVDIGALTVGVWYFIGVTFNRALNRVTTFLGNADTGAPFVTNTGPAATLSTIDDLYFGSNTFGEFLNGRMAGWCLWNRELDALNMGVLRLRLNPDTDSDLYGFYPLVTDTQKLIDFGGHNRNLTPVGVGPWTTEANPLQPWVFDQGSPGILTLSGLKPTITGSSGSSGWQGVPTVTGVGVGIARITGVSLNAGGSGTIGLYGSGANIELPSYFLSGVTPTLTLSDLVEVNQKTGVGSSASHINVDKSEGPFTLTFTNAQAGASGALEIYVKYHQSVGR